MDENSRVIFIAYSCPRVAAASVNRMVPIIMELAEEISGLRPQCTIRHQQPLKTPIRAKSSKTTSKSINKSIIIIKLKVTKEKTITTRTLIFKDRAKMVSKMSFNYRPRLKMMKIWLLTEEAQKALIA